jgi:hypothetical protein
MAPIPSAITATRGRPPTRLSFPFSAPRKAIVGA